MRTFSRYNAERTSQIILSFSVFSVNDIIILYVLLSVSIIRILSLRHRARCYQYLH